MLQLSLSECGNDPANSNDADRQGRRDPQGRGRAAAQQERCHHAGHQKDEDGNADGGKGLQPTRVGDSPHVRASLVYGAPLRRVTGVGVPWSMPAA